MTGRRIWFCCILGTWMQLLRFCFTFYLHRNTRTERKEFMEAVLKMAEEMEKEEEKEE